VFSSMTSFTECLQTSFTLRREASSEGEAKKDVLEDGEGRSAADGVCDGGRA
jgi:hypothetical protein